VSMQTIDNQQIRAIAKNSGAKITKPAYRRVLVVVDKGFRPGRSIE
jgi:hypothetical protein